MKLSKKAIAALQSGRLPPMTEAEFQAQVFALAALHGWRVAHFRGVRAMRKNGSVYWETPVAADGKGFPDSLMVRGTELIVAELKVPPNRETPEQRLWLDAFAAAGVRAYVWYPADMGEIEAVLKG